MYASVCILHLFQRIRNFSQAGGVHVSYIRAVVQVSIFSQVCVVQTEAVLKAIRPLKEMKPQQTALQDEQTHEYTGHH